MDSVQRAGERGKHLPDKQSEAVLSCRCIFNAGARVGMLCVHELPANAPSLCVLMTPSTLQLRRKEHRRRN